MTDHPPANKEDERKLFTRVTDNPRIEVSAPSPDGKGARANAFYASAIALIEEAEDNVSVITLHSGHTFTIDLPYEELTTKIDSGLSPLDLRNYCKERQLDVSRMRPGDKARDGAIFAGISPETKKPFYACAEDEPTVTNDVYARRRAKELSLKTGHNYRIPSASELTVMFNARAAIGNFYPEKDGQFSMWYWTSDQEGSTKTRCVNYHDGKISSATSSDHLSLRLVRD